LNIIDNHIPTVIDQYSPPVKNWIKNMIGKAVDGTWIIGTATAASLLADVIAKYYGLK